LQEITIGRDFSEEKGLSGARWWPRTKMKSMLTPGYSSPSVLHDVCASVLYGYRDYEPLPPDKCLRRLLQRLTIRRTLLKIPSSLIFLGYLLLSCNGIVKNLMQNIVNHRVKPFEKCSGFFRLWVLFFRKLSSCWMFTFPDSLYQLDQHSLTS